MSHPGLDQIIGALSGTTSPGSVFEHLKKCTDCRALAEIAEPGIELPPLETKEPTIVDREHYSDRSVLHRGGMGRAVLAYDKRLGRKVVIKELLEPEAFDSTAARNRMKTRFENEARLTARLQHPAIVGVYEAGVWEDGEAFYAMPFVEGAPLSTEIRKLKTPTERLGLLAALTTVCEAIAYAHDRGVIHRDIKPDNILVGRFGETIVIDWGLAKPVGELEQDEELGPVQDGLTQLGVGTAAYMPPEQARGEQPNAQMDVYALGATLYHVLSGSAPYGHSPTTEVRHELLRGPPIPLVELEPKTPAELVTIVEKAMARDPNERFNSANELAEELRRFQTGQLTKTHQHSISEVFRHWVRKYRAAVRVGLGALVIVAIVATVSVQRIIRERDRAEQSEQVAQFELQRARGASASRLSTIPARRLDAIAQAVLSVGPSMKAGVEPPVEALRGLSAALRAGPAFVNLDHHRGEGRAIDFTADGQRFVSCGTDGMIRVWHTRNGKMIREMRSSLGDVWMVTISDDQKSILASGYKKFVDVWGVDGTGPHTLNVDEIVFRAAWLKTPNHVVTADFGGVVTVFQTNPVKVVRKLKLQNPAAIVTVSKNDIIAVGTSEGEIAVWDWKKDDHTILYGHKTELSALVFHPDGRLVSGSTGGKLLLWDTTGALARRKIEPKKLFESSRQISTAWMSDDGHIVFGLKYHNVRTLNVDSPEKSVVMDGAFWAGGSPFVAGSRMIVTSNRDGPVRLWSATTGDELLRFEGHDATVDSVFASPDGTKMISIGRHELFLWDGRIGRETGHLPAHGSEVVSIQAGDKRFITAGLDGSARVWSASNGDLQHVLRGSSELSVARLSSDSSRGLTAGFDGTARIFDLESPVASATIIRASEEPLKSAQFVGSDIVTGGTDGVLRRFDQDGKLLAKLDLDAPIIALDVNDEGTHWAAVLSGGRIVVAPIHRGNGKPIIDAKLPDRTTITSVFFTPDGSQVLVGTTEYTEVWSVAQRAPQFKIEGRAASPNRSPISPDGKRWAFVTGDGRGLIVDPNGKVQHDFRKHRQLIVSAAWSPDSRQLMTSDLGGAVHRWDAKTGQEIGFVRLTTAASAVAYVGDGTWIVAGSVTGSVRYDPISMTGMLGRACGVLAHFGREDRVKQHCAAYLPAERSAGRQAKVGKDQLGTRADRSL